MTRALLHHETLRLARREKFKCLSDRRLLSSSQRDKRDEKVFYPWDNQAALIESVKAGLNRCFRDLQCADSRTTKDANC